MTRARRRLYVIGDYHTWRSEPFFQELTKVLDYYGPEMNDPSPGGIER